VVKTGRSGAWMGYSGRDWPGTLRDQSARR